MLVEKILKSYADFEWILGKRSFLGEFFSVADISSTSAISSLDYLGESSLGDYAKVKIGIQLKQTFILERF